MQLGAAFLKTGPTVVVQVCTASTTMVKTITTGLLLYRHPGAEEEEVIQAGHASTAVTQVTCLESVLTRSNLAEAEVRTVRATTILLHLTTATGVVSHRILPSMTHLNGQLKVQTSQWSSLPGEMRMPVVSVSLMCR